MTGKRTIPAEIRVGTFTDALDFVSGVNLFHGLPLTGFAAVRYVNGTLPLPGGQGLANYSGVYHHRSTIVCTNGNSSCM